MAHKVIRIGLAGNPNTGKTSVFNAITGAHQKVGNYAGVTVEKKEGSRHYRGYEFRVFDLPGIYSLTAYSIDEVITRDFLLHEKPDIVVNVLDSTNLERNLYLFLQFQELGLPVIGALNIADQAESRGIQINEQELAAVLGMPLVKTVATRGRGVEALLDAVIAYHEQGPRIQKSVSYGCELEAEIEKLSAAIAADAPFCQTYPPRWMAIKLLEKDDNAVKLLHKHSQGAAVRAAQAAGIQRIEKHFGSDAEIVVSEQRYGYIRGAIAESVRVKDTGHTATEMIDALLLNRYVGLPIFLICMWLIFRITFMLGAYPVGWFEHFFSWFGNGVGGALPPGLARSLVVDGIIGGVGGVFSFVPLVIVLFLCLSFLEDTGYMARAAFLTDKFLHVFGLHGQSFMPLVLGFGCTVPAVMAARTLKNERDRILTIMVLPFMSCGAKLPVHVLLAGAFFAARPGDVVFGMYLIGAALALVSSMALRSVVFRGEVTPFVMELPPYRMPTLAGMVWHVKDKTLQYLKRAGTVILAVSILVWFLTTFPRTSAAPGPDGALGPQPPVIEHSYAGRMGKIIEPAIRPLGFDWKLGIATVTGFAAKEVVVSTLGVLYKISGGAAHEEAPLRQALRADPALNPLVAFVFMLFMLLIPPCAASMVVIRAEIGWKWFWVMLGYSIALAWVLCFAVYQSGRFLAWGV